MRWFVVLFGLGLAACNPFMPRYTEPDMPASPYLFKLGQVAAELDEEALANAPVNVAEISGKITQRLNTGIFATNPAQLNIVWEDYATTVDDLTYKLTLSAQFSSTFRQKELAQGHYTCVAEGTQPFELFRKARAKFGGEAFTMSDYAARIWDELLEQCLDDLAADYLKDVQTATLP